MSERIDASELPALLEPGMRVYVGGGACEPQTLVRALRLESEAAAGVTFIQSIVPGLSRTDFAAFHPEARIVTFFMTPETQESFALGKVDFVPMQLRAIGDYLAETRIDAALIQVAATDDPAWYSPGVNADYIDAVIENAGFIVAEVNAQMPAPRNAPRSPPNGSPGSSRPTTRPPPTRSSPPDRIRLPSDAMWPGSSGTATAFRAGSERFPTRCSPSSRTRTISGSTPGSSTTLPGASLNEGC